ncbi:hypothetical protein [Methylobacterium sp. E-066]|uniref:hypothetical protein n=1 Tax=Methylobacterium sp. E-066 TaxID=2836584 RepID=UPI001FBA425F|nr:hypothetical protein [Methylobacterium sp. E-066]MCJ2139975.1 hypothetical protein [Methylobacterium sp. E-066]
MTENLSDKSRILMSIADALGTEPSAFFTGDGLPTRSLETQELLSAFARIRDPKDRRTCIDFVNSVLARQGTTDSGA